MNLRILLASSIFINVLLVAGYAYRPPATPAPAPEPAKSVAPKTAPRSVAPRVETIATKPDDFHWTKIEAEDYRQYIANLRAIGCPEDTIRDIIMADINKLYSRKLAPLGQAVRDFKFWQPGASKNRLLAENRKQFAALNQEKWVLLADLLGIDAEAEFRKNNPGSDYLIDEFTVGFLPESKRARVREILERYQTLEQELAQRGPQGPVQRGNPELKKLQDQRQQELAATLSPEEMEEYDLRNSTTAETLRSRLAGTNLTEEQFRQLFRAQKQFDDSFSPGAMAMAGPQARAQMEARTQAQSQLENQFRSILGDAAFRDYQRAQDLAYRGLTNLTRDFGVSQTSIDKAYEIKQAVEGSVRQLFANDTLSAPERAEALKTISDETQRTLLELLGQKGYEAYKQNGGYWIPSENGGTMVFTSRGDSGETMAVRAYRVETGNGEVRGGGSTGGTGQPQRTFIVPPQ